MKEIPTDIRQEKEAFLKEKLFEWAWTRIRRGCVAGVPDWYKEQLLRRQFSQPVA